MAHKIQKGSLLWASWGRGWRAAVADRNVGEQGHRFTSDPRIDWFRIWDITFLNSKRGWRHESNLRHRDPAVNGADKPLRRTICV